MIAAPAYETEGETAEFGLSASSSDVIRAAAARRAISPGELGRRIIETVVRDGLIDAVLDDGEGPHG